MHRRIENSTTYIAFNAQKPPFTDKRVRQALAAAVDVNAMVQAVYRGVGAPAAGPIPPNMKYHDNSLAPQVRDVAKAKRLLAEAGLPNGFKATVTMNDNKDRINMLTIAQNQLKEVGVNIDINVVEWAALFVLMDNNEHDITCVGWNGAFDPDAALYSPFSKTAIDGGSNYARFTTPEFQALLEKGRTTAEGPEREAVYHQLQALALDEQPWVYLYNQEQLVGAKKNIKGIAISPGGYESFAWITIE
jgi:peptide/nickel transport system substrate-binding protein